MTALPGFGTEQAAVFGALLSGQLGVRSRARWDASGEYGEVGAPRSVADVMGAVAVRRVRNFMRQQQRSTGVTSTRRSP